MTTTYRLRNKLFILSAIVFLLFVILNGTAALTTSARLERYLRHRSEIELLQDAAEVNRQLESNVFQKQQLLNLLVENVNLAIAIKRHRYTLLEELFESWKNFSGFLEFVLLNGDGKRIAAGSRDRGSDISMSSWYRDVMEHGVSRIYYEAGADGNQRAVFWIMAPFDVRSNRHTLIAKIKWQSIVSFLDQAMRVQLQNREKFYLILDDNYNLLYLPPFLQDMQDYIKDSLPHGTLAAAAKDVTGNLHSLYFIDQNNCAGYVRSENFSWLVLSLRNEEENRSAITRIYWSSLRINLLILFVGLVIFSLLIWKLVSPLRQLIAVTSEMVRGTYPDKITVPEDREIRQIVESINLMITKVRQQKSEVDLLYEQEKKASKNLSIANELLARKSDELNMKNKEAQLAFDKLQMLQEDLLKAERLTAVGETSGRVAHEVLNPITAILFRVERNLAKNPTMVDSLKGLREILADWQRELKQGTLADYFSLKNENGLSYGEEDLRILLEMLEGFQILNDRHYGDFHFIFKQIQRVIKIINTLREAILTTRSVSRFQCSVPLHEAIELLRDPLQKKNIVVHRNISEEAQDIEADLTEMIQVFTNLLRNAMQSVEQKEQDRSIVVGITKGSGNNIEIRISDNGVGVPHNLKRNIFEYHFTTKDPGEGTGLGLGISRKIIRSYGGELSLEESCDGEGCTFLVSLPAVES